MENVLIDGVSIGKVEYNGRGMCFKAKEMILNSLKDKKKVVVIDPNVEYKELSKILGNKIQYKEK